MLKSAQVALPIMAATVGCANYAFAADSALSGKEFRPLKCTQITKVTHNTNKYRFAFPSTDMQCGDAGAPVASCIVSRAPIGSLKEDGTKKFVIRPYTPITAPDQAGFMDLLVKVYPEGKMSKHFGDLKVGEEVQFKGPFLKFPYQANQFKEIGCIAGGTGITPMLQVIEEVLRNKDDKTKVKLVFANVNPEDILLKDEIDALAAANPDRFEVFYVLNNPPSGIMAMFNPWKGGVGYVNEGICREHLPAPSDDNKVFVCGPPPMMKALSGDKAPDKSQGDLSGLLAGMGYTKGQVFKF